MPAAIRSKSGRSNVLCGTFRMNFLVMWMFGLVAMSVIGMSVGVPLKAVEDRTKDASSGAIDKEHQNTVTAIEDAMKYLRKYGYMGESSDPAGQIVDPTSALKDFQRMAGIEETGVYDKSTKEMMELPRCGVADTDAAGGLKKRRKKRYTIQGSRWRGPNLKYRIASYTNDVSRSVQEEEIRKAFDTWQEHIPLRFTQVPASQSAEIEIKFAENRHGDNVPFDGRGGTLAHAFFPQFGGDAHFDDAERFTANTYGGVDLLMVVAHELGHSLGLGHSDVRSALMAPFYRGYNPSFRLSSDDIRGIQRLYGRNTAIVSTTTTTRPTTTPIRGDSTPRRSSIIQGQSTRLAATTPPVDTVPAFCDDVKLDAMTMFEGRTYAFRGSNYAELDLDGVVEGYPRPISSGWSDLPDNIDTALRWEALYDYVQRSGRYIPILTAPARTYFFKGSLYWRYDDDTGLRAGYPRSIARGFPGLPNDLDASFVWSGNGLSYFIKGSQYYRYQRGVGVPGDYPKPLSDWGGLPSNIDGAMQWQNRRTYFFSGSTYYRYDDEARDIDRGYPRPTKLWWFGCPNNLGEMSNLEMGETEDNLVEVDAETDSACSVAASLATIILFVSVAML